jgi:hypothetical protein
MHRCQPYPPREEGAADRVILLNPPVPPADDAVENREMQENELVELEEKLEMDLQIGEDF